jgi:tetratricopeptide (TPR) repeat protein
MKQESKVSLGLVAFLLLGIIEVSAAAEPDLVGALRELSYGDCITYGPENIVADVSRVLADHKALNNADKGKLLALRASAYGLLDQYEKAKRDFDESLQLLPDNLDLSGERARIIGRLQSPQDGLREIQTLLQKYPKNSALLTAAAELRFADDDVKGCIACAKQALAINNEDSSAYSLLALAFASVGFRNYT